MAWITKNSGTMEIERRDEPWVDASVGVEIKAALDRYPTKRAATMPALHAVQDKHGWIPYQAIEEIAELVETSPAEVMDTATFYEEYFLQPRGKYTIWVCQSISCEIMNSDAIMAAVEDKLGITAGQTTEDGKVTLMHVECIGACGGAPCGLVNHKLVENLTPENVGKIIDDLD